MTLEDQRGIEAVILRYATGIDRRDWALFRTCFTDDVRAEYGAFGSWDSGDAITASMQQMHAPMGATLHRIGNIVVEATEGGARSNASVDAMLCRGAASEPFHNAIGTYDDTLVRTASGWRIATRRFTLIRFATIGGSEAPPG